MARSVLAGKMSRAEAGTSFGVAAKTVPKWAGCFQALGSAGCAGPHRGMSSRGSSPCVAAARIAEATGVPTATAVRAIRRAGLSRLKDPESEEPARRYQHDRPVDITCTGIKKLDRFERPGHKVTGIWVGRRQGVAGSTSTSAPATPRTSHAAACFPDGKREGATGRLRGLLRAPWGRRPAGDADNGPCHASRAFAAARKDLWVRHGRTKPCTPRINGAAEPHLDSHAGAGLRPAPRDVGPARRRFSGVDAHARLVLATRRSEAEATHQQLAGGFG